MLICKDLSVGYNGKPVASGINFTVEHGDYVCIVGENGSGKSTLLRTILSLIPPVSGEIVWTDEYQKKETGYLPQRTDVQKDFPASVLEIVLSGFQGKMGLRPFYSKKEKYLALEKLAILKMDSFAKQSFKELSGGQQQRVLLARALCATENLLVLDEPVAALDAESSKEFYDEIKNLNEKGVSILMITHDLVAAKKYSNKIVRLGENK
ncbi:metal ABC transporter ATP-binding protein [Treponema zioleckii]|uniref:metal ABC transporter ATP-binding protein n=1 Tax=Treponema zioleckii TaxID=331680 RepID=UPI00168BE31D|nr:metal ABC transporter ATP-binding protein [Treponema zioleckii]